MLTECCEDPDEALVMQESVDEPMKCAGLDHPGNNKRRGAPRDGEGQCAGCDASEGYVSDVEVRLHDVHVHDQVFITKNDEHFEEISMKQ